MKKYLFCTSLISLLLLSGCGSGGSSSRETTTATVIDNVVSGVKYVNGSDTGYTDSNGQFPYKSGLVEFYVGEIKIGEINSLPSDNLIFIQDIVGVDRTDTSDSRVLKIASFLQSLDSDDSTEMIELSRTDFDKFNSINDHIENLDINTIMANANFTNIRNNTNAKRHMDNVLKYYGIIDNSTAPTVHSSMPSNSATGVSLSSNIVVTFSEDLPRDQMTVSNIKLSDSSSNVIAIDINFEWNTLTITPSSSLLSNETYTLTLKSSLRDFANNTLVSDMAINFDTVISDTTPPIINSSSPENNDVNVGTSDNLTITFDESLDATTINESSIFLIKTSDNSLLDINISYDENTKTVTINPDVDLDNDIFYKLRVGTLLMDISANAFASTQDINFMVGDTITDNGFTYGTITSSLTGKVWLDRNLGASQVCTVYNDTQCYGDYYQWGRDTDGHEKSNSNTTSTQASSINPSHGNFIIDSSDWSTTDREGSTTWNPCPSGYKVPTITELTAENISNGGDAYSKLKLPSAGYRNYSSGALDGQGSHGSVWSSSLYGSSSRSLGFNSGNAGSNNGPRAHGFSVRCVRD